MDFAPTWDVLRTRSPLPMNVPTDPAPVCPTYYDTSYRIGIYPDPGRPFPWESKPAALKKGG
jgi:hypothetical protein